MHKTDYKKQKTKNTHSAINIKKLNAIPYEIKQKFVCRIHCRHTGPIGCSKIRHFVQ
jgi:hypothetical protein